MTASTPATHHRPASTEPVPTTMRAVTARRYGTPEVVAIEEVPTPTPGQGEVLVRVRATSLNALDWHFLTGTPYFLRLMAGLRRPKHVTPGVDLAGTVVAVGPGVADLAPGDEVFGECAGGCATYAVAKAAKLVRTPAGVAATVAGAAPVAGLTALQALRTHGRVQPGERVLVNGAAGGVGTFAVQIARALGAEVTAVCSARNVEMVRALGPSEVIDYATADVTAGGARFDVMIDNVGNHTASACIGLLVPGGRYVAVSGPKENRWIGPIPQLVRKGLAFRRSPASFHQFTESANRDDLAFLGGLLAAGTVVPAVDRVIGLDGVADALAELGTGHARAKIVVVPG